VPAARATGWRGWRSLSGRRRLADGPGESGWVALAYVVPAFVVLSLILLIPLVLTVALSLTSWDGLGPIGWVGLDNYVAFASDPLVTAALRNAVALTIFYSVLPILLGLTTAIVISRVGRRLRTLWRTLLFLPAVIAPVVVAVGWRLIYEPGKGLLNQTLEAVGLGTLARPWLGDFALALPATGVAATWMEYGLVMVLFLAGLQRIPVDRYDAARVDGAGLWAEIRHVTLPGLRYELIVAAVVTVIASFRNFDLVFNHTRGGPGSATVVPVLEVYRRGFLHGQVGSAAALGTSITLIILALTGSAYLFARRRGVEA
jgi:raffinose/stachyose/melibiose transport system permease protein